jgi:hypothetical protein
MINKEKEFRFRVNDFEKKFIEEKAKKLGFFCVSEYIRYVALNVSEIEIKMVKKDE